MTGCSSYPSYNAIQQWAAPPPQGIGEDPLWGTAFAAEHCRLPQTLDEFHQFQTQAYNWATGGIGLVVEYYLGFVQSHGYPPPDIPALNTYLDAVLGQGHPNLNVVKPQGGLGYPPGSPTSFTQGYQGPAYAQQADGTWVPRSASATSTTGGSASATAGTNGAGSGAASSPGAGPAPLTGGLSGIEDLVKAHPVGVAVGAGVALLLLLRR